MLRTFSGLNELSFKADNNETDMFNTQIQTYEKKTNQAVRSAMVFCT